jgi:hypothetical protein
MMGFAWRGLAVGAGGDVQSDSQVQECMHILARLQSSSRLS